MDSVKKLIREMFLYGIFGLFSASMDTLSFFLLSKTSIPLLLSNFISVNIGITISFFLNTYLNFKKKDEVGKRAIKFFSVGYIGLILSMLIMWVGVDVLNQKQMLVKIGSVVFVAAVQYLSKNSIVINISVSIINVQIEPLCLSIICN